ncbi:MAG TPA: hypothetical protein VMA83_11860 [Solirubrobacteraceae bacterium]|nr:hypothetical protein [Solirubrobacteraceae bacterium]
MGAPSTATSPPRPAHAKPSRAFQPIDFGVLAAYVVLCALALGREALLHPTRELIGVGLGGGRDEEQFAWDLQFAAHALTHLEDPLHTTLIYAPLGRALAWTASLTSLGIAATPLTLLFGAFASFNVVAVLAPAVSGWAVYLMCRILSPRGAGRAPAVGGGALFAIGTYEVVETASHLNLSAVALVPVAVALVALRLQRRIGPGWFVTLLAVTLGVQIYTSSEVLATMTAAGVLLLLATYWLVPPARVPMRALPAELVIAYGGALVIGLPFLLSFYHHRTELPHVEGGVWHADLANLFVSTPVTEVPGVGNAFGVGASHLSGVVTEQVAYVGVPLVGMLAAFLWEQRRTAAGRLTGIVLAGSLLFALGSKLTVLGHETAFRLPWELAEKLPLLSSAIPARLMLYFWLACSVACAYFLARREIWRWLLFAVVLISVAPASFVKAANAHLERPALVNDRRLLASVVPAGATVLTVPFGQVGAEMGWQVQSGLRFRLAGGYVGFYNPERYVPYERAISALEGHWNGVSIRPELCGLIASSGSSIILERLGDSTGRFPDVFRELGLRPREIGGFRVADVAPALRAAGACAAS